MVLELSTVCLCSLWGTGMWRRLTHSAPILKCTGDRHDLQVGRSPAWADGLRHYIPGMGLTAEMLVSLSAGLSQVLSKSWGKETMFPVPFLQTSMAPTQQMSDGGRTDTVTSAFCSNSSRLHTHHLPDNHLTIWSFSIRRISATESISGQMVYHWLIL